MRNSNIKKLYGVIISALLIATAVMLSACTPRPSLAEGDFSTVTSRVISPLSADESGKFRILQLTDTHLYGNNTIKDKKTISKIKTLISANEYDLVIITGDMLEGYNKKINYNKPEAVKQICELFEAEEQFWTFAPGNNDGEFCGDNKAIFSALVNYKYCLVSDAEVGGVGNFTIDINDNGELAHTLFIIDSRMRGNDGTMLAIDKTQIEWYERESAARVEAGIFTSIFMHVPFLEFADAFINGEVVDTYANHAYTLDINVNPNSSNFLKAIEASGNNGLIGTGHTHGSDYLRFYKGFYWLQVSACGYSAWNDKLPRGGASIEIDTRANSVADMYIISNIYFD